MRTTSLNMRKALFGEASGEVPVFLVTITDPLLPTPLRFSSDATQRLSEDPLYYGTVSRGQTYLYVGMDATLSDERDRSAPSCQLSFGNIDREAITMIRSMTEPPSVKVEVVLVSSPDLLEIEIPSMLIANADYDATQVTLSLSINSMTNEPYPGLTFSPAAFPGLFV